MTVSSDTSAIPGYDAANDAINRVIFDGRHKLVPVYIDLEGGVADEVARLLNVPPAQCQDVIAATVAKSLTWNQSDPFTRHLGDLDAWTSLDRFGAPPFTALLAVLTMAAERMRGDESYSENNYYERLFEVLKVDNETRKNSLRQNAKSTKRFWDALNSWLASEDFEYGRPTAKRVNKWPYVSFALSQAMMREGDRKRLHDLFIEFGLAPREQLTEAEMTLYLHLWMRSPAPSAWLRRVWSSPDLRDRIAAAACAELEVWDGAGDTTGEGRQRRRLTWSASLAVFPRRQFRIYMSAAGDTGSDQLNLSLPDDADPAAMAAFQQCRESLWLTPVSAGEISVLEPVRDINLSPLMLASFMLESDRDGPTFHKVARPIVPLIKTDTGSLFREVSRVSLLRPHLILCHTKWDERVTTLLNLNARKGFLKYTADTLQGIPEDWILFTNVEMLRISSAQNNDLQALVPLSEGVSVEIAGGLKLSQNLWHAASRPEITAAASDYPLKLSLSDAAGNSFGEKELRSTSCRLSLAEEKPWEGANLTLTVSVAGNARSETQISFRSAAQPRPLSELARTAAYSFSPVHPRGFFTAKAGSHERQLFMLNGMIGCNEQASELHHPRGALADLPPTPEAGEELPVELEQSYHLERADGLQETCVLRGYHHWICDAFEKGEDSRDEKWMACEACHNRVLTRNRGVVHRHNTKRTVGKISQRQDSGPLMRARQADNLNCDFVLDALSYLGSGSWRKLQDIAASGEQSPLQAQRLISALMSLGHIDVLYDERLRGPQNWIVAPPSLVFTPSKKAFLAGFRSSELITKISQCLEKAGGILESHAQEDAPTAYVWSGLSLASLKTNLMGVHDPHGRPVTISSAITTAIVCNAPSCSQLLNCMPPVHLGQPRDLQRFEVGAGRWEHVKDIQTEGAYRGDFAGRRYVYRNAEGIQREGSFSLVKLLAARAEGLKLHGYDSHGRVFKAVLGCEPPALFTRALVASSGLVPRRDGNQLHFSSILPEDAETILYKLYS